MISNFKFLNLYKEHQRLINDGQNKDLNPVKVPVIFQPQTLLDNLIEQKEGKRFDYKYFLSQSDLDMPSCRPRCHKSPEERCPSYTGFPLFLMITSLLQVVKLKLL